MKIFTFLLLCLLSFGLKAQERFEIRNPDIIQSTFYGESEALRDYVPDPNYVEKVINPEKLGYNPKKFWPLHESVNPDALPKGTDPALQERYATSKSMRNLDVNIPGIGYTFVNPSDNNLAVGPNHVIQIINGNTGTMFQVFNKAGISQFGPANFSTLFGSSGGGDPIVLYDQLADRWLVSEFGVGNSLFVAISSTSDPLGTFYKYSFSTPGFPDYPKYSIWPNAYYVTTNESTPAIYALDRAKMLAGQTMAVQRFSTPSYPTIGFQANTPVSLAGTSVAPPGSPAMLMRMADDAWSTTIPNDRLEIYEVLIDFATPANSVFSGPTFLTTEPFDTELNGYTAFSAFPQPNSSIKLDPLREVLMHQVQYRNFGTYEAIVCNHVTDVDGNNRGGVRWYELRRSGNNPWTIYQQGTYSPDADNRWMGAIAINGNGDIGLMYNITSSTTYPGIRYTGRKACDPPGVMTEPETVIKNGSASNGSNRYGDYNSLSTDPSDEETFWGTAQYNPATQWSTQIAAFKVNGTCNCYPDSDTDSYGDPGGVAVEPVNDVCPNGYVLNFRDCDDTDPAVNPSAIEVCDGVDNNCDGQIDEGVTTAYYIDLDGDGYGAGNPVNACQAPDINYVLINGDCDDNISSVNPGASEICNGIDDNCDGITDFPVSTVYTSLNVPVVISPTGQPTVTSTLEISGFTGNIIDLNLKNLKILHSWIGDLKATLTSPGGAVINLFDRPRVPASVFGCGNDNILAAFDDEATLTSAGFESTCNTSSGSSTYAISGTYQPLDALAALSGTSPNGTWILTVYDAEAGDGGSIESWELEITGNGVQTTYYADMDGDTYGDPANSIALGCAPDPLSGWVTDNTDCDDNDATSHTTNTFYVDNDNDGFGSTATAEVCSPADCASGSIAVKFRVDMTGQTIEAGGVHIAGQFATLGSTISGEWDPAAAGSELTAVGGNIYEITVMFPASAAGQRLLFKILRNNAWDESGSPPDYSESYSAEDNPCIFYDAYGFVNRVLTLPDKYMEWDAAWNQCPNMVQSYACSNTDCNDNEYNPTNSYSITTTAGTGGTITSSTAVSCGGNATVTVTPNPCYSIVSVTVDGVPADLSAHNLDLPYDIFFNNVTADHIVEATFAIKTYTIEAIAGPNGTISPDGVTPVNCGDDQTYTITGNSGFAVQDVIVDGVSQGAVGTYTFTNVTAPHTISASFVVGAFTITANAGTNGTISPIGAVSVTNGGSQSFNITADPCYKIETVLVDGVNNPAAVSSGTYTFTNVTAPHTISATFSQLTYVISANAGPGGFISPIGNANVNCGNGTWTYIITPDACYSIADVLVDGVSIGAVSSYTFTYVNVNRTISATFSPRTFNITASAGPNGTVTPNGVTSVNCGASQTYTIIPAGGFAVQNVIVDNVSQGAIGTYTFTNVNAPHTISATFMASALCSATGNISYQVWNNIGSSYSIGSLTGNVNYPNNPSSSILITTMEAPPTSATAFGSRIAGYICAPATGSYTFWIASDNEGELWLSTNDQPANKVRIAFHNGNTFPREWNKYATQKSVAINLVQGQKYYIESLMKQVWGGSCQVVGWLKPGQSGSVPSEVIPGAVLSPLGPAQTILVSSVALPQTAGVNVGSSVLIPATVLPANASNPALSWMSGNPAIATVNGSGLVTGMAVGNVTITATSTDGSNKSGSCLVTVNAVPAVCSATGNISYQVWNNIGSSYSISSLTGNVNYPDNPSSSALITTMEAPPTSATAFGSRIAGYICAPATGSYTFWIASDNEGELWLSTNDQPANKVRIAYHNGNTLPREWNKYATQKSVAINLVQGQKYYIESLMKQVWGGSCQVVGWLKPGQSGSVPSEVIPGTVLSPLGPVQTILVSSVALPPTAGVNVGSTVLIPATVLPANASNPALSWMSGNPAIATVNSSGLVTGMAAGNVTITATSTDGSNKSGSCLVTVNAVPAVCSASGNISYQVWNNIGSSYSISSLTGNVNYPDNPSSSALITTMEAPPTSATAFGSRIAGYICAPATGSYTFWIASDNEGELWLSTNDQPANKVRIAFHSGNTLPREWNKYATQKSVAINLVQGQKYYIESLMKQVWGGSCHVVGWLRPGQAGSVPSEVIPGSVLSPLAGTVLSPLAAETKIAEANGETAAMSKLDVTLFVYPNPVTNNDAVTIKLENLESEATLRIFTISGVKCYEEIVLNSGIIRVDRSVFKSGMYIIKVENEEFVKTTKLIVN